MDWRSVRGSGKTREEVISKSQAKVSAACTKVILAQVHIKQTDTRFYEGFQVS